KPVLMSDTDPNPREEEPAINERVPFRSGPDSLAFARTTGDPSGRMRSTGRFAVERSTHSQSPSSTLPRRGANCTASKIVLKVRFRRTPAPARILIFSRKVGRNEGADTFTLEFPGASPAIEKNPFSSVKALRSGRAGPNAST